MPPIDLGSSFSLTYLNHLSSQDLGLDGHLVVLVNDHVTSNIVDDNALVLHQLLVLESWERSEDLGDITPPLLTELLVPLDGDGESLLERSLLVPAQVAELGAIDGVAAVVEWAVVSVLDPLVEFLLGGVWDLEVSKELGAEGQVGDLVVRANVVDLANGTLVENGVEGIGSITSEEITARWGTITVKDEWLTTVQQAGELWNDLCELISTCHKYVKSMVVRTLWVLVWSVDVVGANNDDRHLERLLVRVNQHLSGGLGGSVRVGWGENRSLEEIIILILNLSVDLIGGDVDEALDVNLLGRLEKDVSAVDVGVGEAVGVSEGQVNVRLSREVEDGVNVVTLQAVHNLGWVCDITMVEREVSLIVQGAGVVEGRAVVELVEGDDVVGVWVGEGEVTNQPAGAIMRFSQCVRRIHLVFEVVGAYMKPAPPVIMMFFTSGSGSNLVLPVRIGALFQTLESSKKSGVWPLVAAKVVSCAKRPPCIIAITQPGGMKQGRQLTGWISGVGGGGIHLGLQ